MTSETDESSAEVLRATRAGDGRGLAAALAAGGDANAKDRWGVPALSVAAGRGDLEAVRLLLARGGDPNLASAVGNAPLMVAAARGRPEVVQVLLEAGANPAAANRWGLNAADWAKWASEAGRMQALLSVAKSEP